MKVCPTYTSEEELWDSVIYTIILSLTQFGQMLHALKCSFTDGTDILQMGQSWKMVFQMGQMYFRWDMNLFCPIC